MVATKHLLTRARSNRPTKMRRTDTSVARAVRNLQETKYLNTTLASASATSHSFNLNAIPANDSQSGRDGRKVLNTNIRVCARAAAPMRVVIYCPKDPSSSLTLATQSSVIENDEFWVLYDSLHTSGGGTGNANITLNKHLT